MKNKKDKAYNLQKFTGTGEMPLAPSLPTTTKAMTIYDDPSTVNFSRARIKEGLISRGPTGDLKIRLPEGDLVAFISDYNSLTSKLGPFEQKLFTASRGWLFELNGDKKKLQSNKEISISMDECLKLFGKSPTKDNRKNLARKLFSAGLTLPSLAIISTKDPRNPETCRAKRQNIYSYADGGAHGFTVKFTDEYAEILVQTFYTSVPSYYFEIDERRPSALTLLHKLNNYYNMNRKKIARKSKKKPEELRNYKAILKVPNALRFCPEIPDKETVLETDRHLSKRIIEPFEKNLNYLSSISNGRFKWEYCNRRGSPLKENQLTSNQAKSDEFFNRYILYSM